MRRWPAFPTTVTTFLLLLTFFYTAMSSTITMAAPPQPPPPVALPCPNPTFGGQTYDISSIKGHKLSYVNPQTGIKFSFGVCTAVTTGPPLCDKPDSNTKTAMLAYCPALSSNGVGVVLASPKFSPKYKPVTSGKGGKVIGIQADLPSAAPIIKFVGLKYLCNEKATTPQMRVVLPPEGKVPMGFNITITTKAACGVSGPSGSSGSNWSTWFFVIFSVSVVLYCGGGCFVNIKRNGESLSNACPQRGFWCGLPGLVMDGIAFFFSCFGIGSGAVGGSNRGYTSQSSDYDKLDKPKPDKTGESNIPAAKYGTSTPAPAEPGLPNPYGTISGAPTPRRKKELSSSGRHNDEMADAFADTDDV